MAETKETTAVAEAAPPATAYYVFPRRGGTRVGKILRTWKAHQVVEAPDGTLDHVADGKKFGKRAAAEKSAAASKKAAQKKN